MFVYFMLDLKIFEFHCDETISTSSYQRLNCGDGTIYLMKDRVVCYSDKPLCFPNKISINQGDKT